jgi:hypothetical protein
MYVGPLRRGQNETLAQERLRAIAMAVLAGVADGASAVAMTWIARAVGAPPVGVSRRGAACFSRKTAR